jgi:RNA polymerase sigma factor (sigma-70 family)
MDKKKKTEFEDYLGIIDEEIKKRRGKWNLKSLAWMDFDDVSQIIRFHLFKKWHLYDSSKPLGPWLNKIISNQIKNLIRNNYGNYSRPCLRCAAAEGENLCIIYTKQCSACPLYAHWEKHKKRAHDLKIAAPLEFHQLEIRNQSYEETNFESNVQKLHARMEEVLKPLEWKIYDYLYIQNKDEEEVAKLMGYKTSEKNRAPGYKQIKNIKKSIIRKVKKSLKNEEIDLY